jgi:paraquat-inducible protein A
MSEHAEISASSNSIVRQRTAAFASAALVLYPLGIFLPVIELERLGHVHRTSILGGISDLLSMNHWFLALVILVCSVVIPICKLAGLLVLSIERFPVSPRNRDVVWRFLEITGRWGMLDVLLVAGLVAAVKLGDLVTIEPGPGVYAFGGTVILSLLASACWDPTIVGGHRE